MGQIAQRRPLNRLERSLGYGLLGWAAEVGFSGVRDVTDPRTRSWRLEGHSYLWMLPIYGLLAFLFEPLHDRLRARPLWVRAAAYAAGFSAVECATGMSLRRAVGVVPWDYTGHGRWVLPGGATRLDYAPVFAAAGLVLEHVHDAVRDLPVRRISA
jgi:hypothetical protein